MADNESNPGTVGPSKWHESGAAIIGMIVFGLIATSPCWGFALLLWVVK